MTTKNKLKVNKTYTTADFASWGSIGGKAAKGDKKRQPDSHYKQIASKGGKASGEARRLKALQNKSQ